MPIITPEFTSGESKVAIAHDNMIVTLGQSVNLHHLVDAFLTLYEQNNREMLDRQTRTRMQQKIAAEKELEEQNSAPSLERW